MLRVLLLCAHLQILENTALRRLAKNRSNEILLVEHRRAHNICIELSGIRMPFAQIKVGDGHSLASLAIRKGLRIREDQGVGLRHPFAAALCVDSETCLCSQQHQRPPACMPHLCAQLMGDAV